MRRILGLYVGRGRDGERPPLATVLFWLGCALPLVARTRAQLDQNLLLPSWLLLTVLVLLLVLWPRLDWQPSGSRWKVMVVFALTAVAFGFVDGSGSSVLLLLVVLANIVLTLGPWTAVAASAVLGLAITLTVPLVYRQPWGNALAQGGGAFVLGLATVAVAQVISAEQRRRLEAGGLLEELRTAHADLQQAHDQLASAHTQLQRRSDQVHELAVAEERARLAREVHDAVGHHLTVVKLGLTNALRLHERASDAAGWDEVAEARAAATTALDEVRRAVRAMGPGPLAQANLGTALTVLTDSFDSAGLTAGFVVDGAVRPLGPTVDATLYRVTEEALTNVRRHATGASRVQVRLAYRPHEVELTVADDGRTTQDVVPGFGLSGARARLAEVGGELRVGGHPGPGVVVQAIIPADNPADVATETPAVVSTVDPAIDPAAAGPSSSGAPVESGAGHRV